MRGDYEVIQASLEVEGARSSTNDYNRLRYLWTVAIIAFLGLILLYLFAFSHFHWSTTVSARLPRYITLQHSSSLKYLRETSNGDMLLTEDIPWIHGSRLFVDQSQDRQRCFALRTSRDRWLVLDRKSMLFKSSTIHPEYSTLFVAVAEEDGRVHRLRLCDEDVWVSSTEARLAGVSRPSDAFLIHDNHQLFRGVNLGGWFVPEVWMRRSFFNGTGLGWAGSLCALVRFNRTLAEDRTARSLASWITEQDFSEIAFIGYNSVRLPIGFWNVIEDPRAMYAPAELAKSLEYIDLAFDWAERHGLSVILDLHGAPGSQNGIDHSGCGQKPAWLESVDNIDLTLRAIDAMVARYAGRPALLGIELVNEPGREYSLRNHSVLLDLYERAYELIRARDASVLVIFNELYEEQYSSWREELVEPKFYNVVLDLHLYDWQLPFTFENSSQHVQDARGWRRTIAREAATHPVIIGEWSMSTGTFVQAGQVYVDAAVESFEDRALGWYLWNWKIERGLGFPEWDAQLQHETIASGGLQPVKHFLR